MRLTVAQAVVTFLSRQYSVADGQRRRLIPATLGIFGHGNVAGLGQALDQLSDVMPFIQGRNEQALVHAATAFAKHSRRHATLAVTSSIGPGALNMVTGAALATVNRLPVLLLPGDTYATRHQGPVLQQLQHPLEADVTVNDAFRPVCRFFDRITRPEQLLTALPAAMRVLTDPVDAGAVVLSLPQDIQSHAYDWPAGFFAERDWGIRRPQPDRDEVAAVLTLLAAAARPLIIAGGGVIYSGATAELERLAGTVGIPVLETFAGKGAVQQRAWWQIGGIGLEGTPAANTLAREADLVLTVGARLTDFATASHSLFANPGVRFASVNVNPRDADRLGATGIIADARLALAALADAATAAGTRAPAAWRARAEQVNGEWAAARAAALDPDRPFDPAQAGPDVVTSTDAVLTQGQVIGVLQEHARPGDVVIAAAGGPPGDLLKVWDATGGRHCHLEFGFSCMGYEIPAAIGVRLADPAPGARVISFLGDGTFLLAPTELVTAAAEGLAVTLVVPDNRGYQVIHRLQMLRSGREFGNEFRYRPEPLQLAAGDVTEGGAAGGRLPPPGPGAGRGRPRRPGPAGHDRGRGAAGAGRDARLPGTGRDRGAGHPARRPARRRGLVGRRPSRGIDPGDHRRAAGRVRDRPEEPEVVRMSAGPLNSVPADAGPLNHGALAAAVRSGVPTLGTFIGTASPLAAEVCAAAGVDWVLLDLEHGAGGEEQVRDVVPAAGSYGVPTVVRVESAARIRMGRVLDSGAAGIMLPRLNTVDEVAEAVRHLRYPPAGDRGVATYNRACRFGLDPGALDRANAEVLGVVQIESATAVGDADQIAGLDGVDVLFVGPRDLSHDLGVPGDLTAPAFTEAIEHVLAACRRHGKACGLLVTDGAAAARRLEQGWSFVAIGSDTTLLATAVSAELGRARTSSKPQ